VPRPERFALFDRHPIEQPKRGPDRQGDAEADIGLSAIGSQRIQIDSDDLKAARLVTSTNERGVLRRPVERLIEEPAFGERASAIGQSFSALPPLVEGVRRIEALVPRRTV
jgi:hypothetical protein